MIQIGIPMPKRCADCPCYDHTMYGRCKAKDVWFDMNDRVWHWDERPKWCPIMEVTDEMSKV